MRTLLCLVATAAGLFAQTAPPNEAGVSLGHIHLVVSDPDAQKKAWVDVFGAQSTANGAAFDPLKLPGIFIIISKARMPPTGGTDGSVVNHIGLSVKDYAATKAKWTADNLMAREVTPNAQALVTFPEGVIVEVIEDKNQATPVAFHHIHEYVPDGEVARAWYMKELGAASGTRRNLPAAMFPGGQVDFVNAKMPTTPTQGRALDHIGFEVKDLDALLKKLAADGVTINMPLRDMTKQLGLKIAFITDPNGTYIELTQGLSAK